MKARQPLYPGTHITQDNDLLAKILGLTRREFEILSLMPARCQKEIASQLSLALSTVRNHQTSIYRALRVEHRLDAVTKGLRIGILTLEDD